jgi:putative ABC transport system permease protein
MYISRMNYSLFMRNKTNNSRSRLRKILVILQFTASIVLITCTLVIYKQISDMRQQQIGVDVEKTLVIKAPTGNDSQYAALERFRQQVNNVAGISFISGGSDIPGQFINMGWTIERRDVNPKIYEVIDGGSIDYNYIPALNLKLVAGNNFSRSINNQRKIIFNEAMVRYLHIKNNEEAIGKQVILPEISQEPYTILGVLKDYHQQSPNKEVTPVFFLYSNGFSFPLKYYIVKMQTKQYHQAIADVSTQWVKLFPHTSFDYFFLDNHYEKQYAPNIIFGKLFGFLACLAIFVLILGLFGLSIYSTEQRTKEIGIRKVNGAKISEVMLLLNHDFVKWVAIAFIIACPIAWYSMHKWLESFAYKTELSWWIFALAGIVAVLVAVMTVGWQSWKAATRNPVEALRNE